MFWLCFDYFLRVFSESTEKCEKYIEDNKYAVTFRNSFYYDFEFKLFQNIIIFIFVFSAFILAVFVFYKGFRLIK